MLQYPTIDPVAVSLGPLNIHWYGLMYLGGFIGGYWLALYRAKQPGSDWTQEQVGDLLFYVALGVVLGGRIGYTLFYDLSGWLANPLSVFAIWQGGMSFHGGLLGVGIGYLLIARKFKKSPLSVADFCVPVIPLGLGLGRMGNFIGAELYGRVTDLPWGMVFPGAGPLPRHPSQLYQFVLEGGVLMAVLWWYSSKPRPTGAVTGLFLLLYGGLRFAVEFVRQPDAHMGFIALEWLTMGQMLSLPMIALGSGLLIWAYKKQKEKEKNA